MRTFQGETKEQSGTLEPKWDDRFEEGAGGAEPACLADCPFPINLETGFFGSKFSTIPKTILPERMLVQ